MMNIFKGGDQVYGYSMEIGSDDKFNIELAFFALRTGASAPQRFLNIHFLVFGFGFGTLCQILFWYECRECLLEFVKIVRINNS